MEIRMALSHVHESAHRFWYWNSGLVILSIACVFLYVGCYFMAVGYGTVVKEDIYPAASAVLFVLALVLYAGIFEAWVEKGGIKYALMLLRLTAFVFLPIVFTWLSGNSNVQIAEWSSWLKFRASVLVLTLTVAEDLVVYAKAKWLRKTAPQGAQ